MKERAFSHKAGCWAPTKRMDIHRYLQASKVVARAFPELLSGETIVGEDPCAGSSREVVKAE
eukprot:scaffold93182_cov10-Tisochrysis_lutea.AAC.1